MKMIEQEQFANGLEVHFTDESNRYFGDYHRVCVVADIVCDLQNLPSGNPDEEVFRRKAIEAFGTQLSITKRLERMGVPGADVEQVRRALIDDFLQHAASYLSRPEYPHSLVEAELNKSRTHR